MILNIITPHINATKLNLIYKSIITAKGNLPIDIRWYIVYDQPPVLGFDTNSTEIAITEYVHQDIKSVSGNAQINWALDQISEGFVYILDCNNIIHPELLLKLSNELKNVCVPCGKIVKGMIFEQYLEDTEVRKVKVRPSAIDSAQFIIYRDIIGDTRLHGGIPHADGIFIEEIFTKNQDKFIIIHEPLAYYNKIDEYLLLKDSPEKFGVGAIVTIDEEFYEAEVNRSLNPRLRGTIVLMSYLMGSKMKILNIHGDVINVRPLRRSNPYYKNGNGGLLSLESYEKAEKSFKLVEIPKW